MKRCKRILCIAVCALMPLALAACSQDRSMAYSRAVETFSTGDYAAAAEAFARLGDYANSATYLAYSQGLVL